MTSHQLNSALSLRRAGATLISISECLGVSYHELKIEFKKHPTVRHLEAFEVIVNESLNDDESLNF